MTEISLIVTLNNQLTLPYLTIEFPNYHIFNSSFKLFTIRQKKRKNQTPTTTTPPPQTPPPKKRKKKNNNNNNNNNNKNKNKKNQTSTNQQPHPLLSLCNASYITELYCIFVEFGIHDNYDGGRTLFAFDGRVIE